MALDFTDINQAIADSPGASVDAVLLEEIRDNFQDLQDQINLPVLPGGQANFSGMVGTVVNFADQGGTTYILLITPLGIPAGNIGDIGFTADSATQATVYCSGSATSAFRWRVVG